MSNSAFCARGYFLWPDTMPTLFMPFATTRI